MANIVGILIFICVLICGGAFAHLNSVTTCTTSHELNEVEDQVIQQRGLPGKRGIKGEKGECTPQNSDEKLERMTEELINLTSRLNAAEEKIENSQERIVELEKQNSKLQEIVEASQNETEEPSYELMRTPRAGTFEEARLMCMELGGRLLQRTLIKTEGKSYRGVMKTLIPTKTQPNDRCWIGMHDRTVEGRWEFLDFTDDSTSDLVVAWYPANPNNAGGNEHCGEILNYQSRSISINDIPCTSRFYGCCEVKV